MYARRLKYKSQQLGCFLQRSYSLFQSTKRDISQPCYKNSTFSSSKTVTNEFCLTPVCLPSCRRHPTCLLYRTLRFYSSKGDESNASEDKHVPVKDTTHFERGASRHEEVVADSKQIDDYSRFRNLEEQEWLDFEKLSIDAKKNESPFLTKRERFKNEFLRRVIPWKKIAISWETFPYFIDEHVKKLLNECAASHLKHKNFASTYGARLSSSSSRILLRSIPGTELYRERLVRALARDLQVPLLVLDSIVLAPYDFSQQYASESETDDENEESGEECTSESEVENENDASNEEDDSDDIDAIDVKASTKALKKLVVPASLEEFAKRVSGEVEDASSKGKSETVEASQQAKRPLKKGDRVKYVGASVHAEIDNRIILGKIPTSDGSTNAYTFISGRPLSSGQRGEVYEINGDQVAVILDSSGNKQEEENKDEKLKEQISKPPIYWIDSQDIVHDLDTQAEDWYMAMEALCEVLPSLQPIIVYFPDCSGWLSRAVPKSKRKEFIHKLEEMFDQLSGPVVLICGQNKQDNGSKEKKKCTMVLPNLGHLAGLPVPLRQLTEGLTASLSSKDDEIYELFTNTIFISPPKEEATLRILNKHIEEDRRIIISRNNLIQLHKVLQEHELSCLELLHVKTDGVILTMQKAEMVVGWARNHYLSSSISPFVKGNRLMIPRESLEIAISRLKGQEEVSTKPSQSLKSLAKDEYEASFVSAVVSPEEIGVKFDDIGALEDAKRTLRELVTLPMKRPELFSHGNLLRPCKGILLFGPPGTGKTLLAKALATEAGANFLCITGSTITSKWFGDGEKLAKALFSFASKLAPVIIFIDEIDSLLGARGGGYEHEATRRIRNEFMAAWDGLQTKDSQRILVLGATNRPFDLDDAVIRRLPRRVYIDLPDAANRRKILKILLSQENLDPNFKFNELANVTEGYSGSDLKNLCIAAAFRPVEELLEKEEKEGRITSLTPSLRLLDLNDFLLAKSKVGASVAHDSTSMSELRRWNEEYGEGGKRIKSPFGFGD